MGKTLRGSWPNLGRRRDFYAIPSPEPRYGTGIGANDPAHRRAGTDDRNGYNASPVVPNRPGKGKGRRGGESQMNFFRTLMDIWTGDFWKDEREKSQMVLESTRRVINESRAMLDGEDGWLIPPEGRRSKYCDFPQK